MSVMRDNLRTIVRGAYDIQKLRIQMGNRIVGNFKAKLGLKPSKKEDTMDSDARMLLNDLRVRYRKITDGVTTFPRQKTFKGDEIISNYTELVLLSEYFDLEVAEAAHFRRMESVLQDFPIYTEFLSGVKGVGPAMAGVIISEIDITQAEYPSSLWKYAGLDVAGDGKGRSRRSEHLVKVEYKNKDGEMAIRDSITFNPFLKTKLVGVLSSSFLRAGDNKYRTIYDDYKRRLDNRPDLAEHTKLHKHRMALRYMIKRFLVDLYMVWRAIEGLPVAEEYSEAKLHIKHKMA